jgi:antitoxin component of MazEF toxin-antitoxin module
MTKSNPIIKEVNATTGEEVEREMTADELAIYQANKSAIETAQAEAEAKAAAKAELLAKLGITEDEAKLLLG